MMRIISRPGMLLPPINTEKATTRAARDKRRSFSSLGLI
jgi:hypothetical protein